MRGQVRVSLPAVPRVTDETFDAALRGSRPTLVVFSDGNRSFPSADLERLLPVIAQVMADRLDVRVYRMDRDLGGRGREHSPNVVPTLVLFVGGEAVWRVAGTRPAAQLHAELERALGRFVADPGLGR